MVDFSSPVAIPPTSAYGPQAVDFSWLSDLSNKYFKTKQQQFQDQQNQQTQQVQQAFKNGLPIDPQGNIDYAAITNALAKLGDVNAVPQMAPLVRQQQLDKLAATPDALMPPAGPQRAPPPAAAPLAARTPATQQGGDQAGSIVDVVSAKVPEAQAGPIIARVAQTMGVDPNAGLTPGQTIRANGLVKRYAQTGATSPALPNGGASNSSGAPGNSRIADGFAAYPASAANVTPAATPQQRQTQQPQQQQQQVQPQQAPPPPQPQQRQPMPQQQPPQPAEHAQHPLTQQVPLPRGYTDPQQAILALNRRASLIARTQPAQAAMFENWAKRIEASVQPQKVGAYETYVDPKTGRLLYQGAMAQAATNPETSATLDADAERYRQTGSLPPNMGRGAQGAQQATAIRTRAVQQEIEAGGEPGSWPERWQEYRAHGVGLGQAERTRAVREENLKLILKAANAAVPAALEQSEKVWRTGFVPLNKIIQGGEIQTSDPELRAFGMANLQLAEHWARAMNPTGVMRESDRDLALKYLSTADSPSTYRRLVNQLKTQITREFNSIKSGDAAFDSPQAAIADLAAPPKDKDGWTTLPNGARIREVQ